MKHWLADHFTAWWILALVLCYPAIQAGRVLEAWRTVPDRIVTVADARLGSIERTADARLVSIEAKTDAQLTATRGELSKNLRQLQSDANAKIDAALALSDAQLTATRAELLAEVHPVLGQATDALAAYAALPRSIQPTIDYANKMSPFIIDNFHGAITAAKYTLGDVAKASRTFEATSLQINQAAINSADASKQTAIVMTNFAHATKPLPTWLRIGLAVAPSAAQTAFPLWSIFSK